MNHLLSLFFILTFSFSIFAQKESKNYKKAIAYQNEHEYEKAILLYSKVLKSKGDIDYAAQANRGMCYYKTKEYQKAISDLLIIDSLHPNNPITNELLGYSYAKIQDQKNAAIRLQNSIDNGIAKSEQILGQLGASYYFSGNNALAKKYLEETLKINPSNDFALNNLAWANLATEPEVSCKLFHQAYDADSLYVPNINNLGYSHLLCGDLEIAYAYFEKAEKLDPSNSFIYRNYGLYFMYKEDKENACKQLQKAKDLKLVEDYGTSYIEELEKYCKE